jgi:hypothetical protein
LNQKKQVIYYFILSIFALVLILILGFISTSKDPAFFDKLIVGSVFIFSILIGISLAIYPGWHKKQKKNSKNISKNSLTIKFKGHHPNCDKYSSHIIVTKNKTYCAGCLGLIIGSIVTIILIIIYFIFDFSKIDFHLFLIFGILLILILFIIIIFHKRNPFIRIVSNTVFVISFFIIIISILEITGYLIYGLLTGLFSFLLITTRIHISKWLHKNICRNCKKECKMY